MMFKGLFNRKKGVKGEVPATEVPPVAPDGSWDAVSDEVVTQESIPAPPAPERVQVAAGSDMGRVRQNNEDSYLCDHQRGLYIVADGMGGHAAGEVASEMVIKTLGDRLSAEEITRMLSTGTDGIKESLATLVREANSTVLSAATGNWDWHGMGSTVVLVVRDGDILHIMNVGDSRGYIIRDGKAFPVTVDHSVAAALMNQGQVTYEELRTHPLRNQLTSVLGLDAPLEPAYKVAELQDGDRALLCSDGLWDMLPDEDIVRIVTENERLPDAVTALIQAANDHGGEDNVTVVLIGVAGQAKPVTGVDISNAPTVLTSGDPQADVSPEEDDKPEI